MSKGLFGERTKGTQASANPLNLPFKTNLFPLFSRQKVEQKYSHYSPFSIHTKFEFFKNTNSPMFHFDSDRVFFCTEQKLSLVWMTKREKYAETQLGSRGKKTPR
jgi:hypothetical protein